MGIFKGMGNEERSELSTNHSSNKVVLMWCKDKLMLPKLVSIKHEFEQTPADSEGQGSLFPSLAWLAGFHSLG